MQLEDYFQLVNPLVFSMFAVGFFSVYAMRPNLGVLLIAISYVIGAVSFVADIAFEASTSVAVRTGVAALYAATSVLVAGGLVQYYRSRAPWRLFAAIVALHIGLYAVLLATGSTWLRSFMVNFGIGVIFLIAFFHLPLSSKRITDRAIVVLCGLSCLQSFVRPVLVALLVGEPLSDANHNESLWVLTLHFVIGACAVTLGMSMLVAFSREVFEDLLKSSVTDPLTGIYNRRGFELAVAPFLDDSETRAVSVIVADIDQFKSINDRHGHAAGDAVIRAVGQLFEDFGGSHRQIACRLGGEEFVLAIVDGRADDAVHLADAMRREIERLTVVFNDKSMTCTASFGVAQRLPGERLDGLLQRADRALYRSKTTGRNRVSAALYASVKSLKDLALGAEAAPAGASAPATGRA